MLRPTISCLTVAVCFVAAVSALAQPGDEVRPSVYELLINGESFQLQANRLVKLQSKKKPGVSYDVALRVAPTQRLRLNTVQFDYDWLAKVEDDRQKQQRTARLSHELGFSVLITDFGTPLDSKSRDEALKILTDSVTESYRQLKVTDLAVDKPHQRKFGEADGRGVVFRYRDEQQFGHTCLVYVITGPKFAVSCVVQYLDDDFEDVRSLLLKTLNSFRPLP